MPVRSASSANSSPSSRMSRAPSSKVSTRASKLYGATIRGLRKITQKTVDEEPKWRTPGKELLTGYKSEWKR